MNPSELTDTGDPCMEATAKPRLARGLNALLGDLASAPAESVTRLAIEKIAHNPYQPRKQFDPEELAALCASIKNHGVLQPLVVRPVADGYQLIAGERRLRAAKEAGLGEVPVHVVHFDDQQVFEAALVENIQRADLNPIEKAQGFKEYMERFKISHDQLAGRIGIDRTTLSTLLSLLHLPAEIQDAVRLGQLSLSHAKVLKQVYPPELQVALAKEAIMRNYSVHALEVVIKQQKTSAAAPTPEEPPKRAPVEKTAHVKGLEDDLRQRLAVKIEIKVKAKDKGQIVIAFDSNDDFERILDALKK
jgi:ParB family transcriptional regulator, chromosome partitioning protein